jgi:hypothetical protein
VFSSKALPPILPIFLRSEENIHLFLVVIVICMHLLFCEPSIEPKKIEEENMKGLFVLDIVKGWLI